MHLTYKGGAITTSGGPNETLAEANEGKGLEEGRGRMATRSVQTASMVMVFGLLFFFAVTMWDGSSAYVMTATERVGDWVSRASVGDETSTLRTAMSGTCNNDLAFFAVCEVPLAQPLQRVVPAIVELPTVLPGIFAENPNASDPDTASHRCLAKVDAHNANNVAIDVTSTVPSCCSHLEFPAHGAAGAALHSSSCSCDPQECKCV